MPGSTGDHYTSYAPRTVFTFADSQMSQPLYYSL